MLKSKLKRGASLAATKPRSRRGTRLINIIILVIGVFLIVNLTRSIGDLLGAKDKIKEVENQTGQLKRQNDELKKRLVEVQSPEYLEKVARDKLGLAKEGEVVVILPPGQLLAKPSVGMENLPNWQKWWKLFF